MALNSILLKYVLVWIISKSLVVIAIELLVLRKIEYISRTSFKFDTGLPFGVLIAKSTLEI